MAARYLLDSDICVYALSGRHPKVLQMLDRKLPGQVAVSVIALGELLAGAEKSRDPRAAKQRIAALTSVASVLPLPPGAEELILVTSNEREFKRVKGLKVVNWAV